MLADREGGRAGGKDSVDQGVDSFNGESSSKVFEEDVGISEMVMMESCGATIRVEAAERKPLRHAMESESMASNA